MDIEEKRICWFTSDKESFDSKGTALYRACRAGVPRTVKYLLDRGADPHSKDEIGRSCLDVAKAGEYREHEEVVKLLEERGVR